MVCGPKAGLRRIEPHVAEKPEEERLGDLLTVSDAAEFLGVSASTLRNWDRSGKLKAVRHPVNGYRLYRKADLQKLIDQVRRT
jgi:excisionase family DNA binding protein